ncbi:chloride channel protein [Microvirga roseola]|uniref:chloride channel protein n=1 Tax=Microvirga roseola TaxID=2883126 RepID=UPI0022A8B7E0|nr:chloride channel protein [Microvirga roseola]
MKQFAGRLFGFVSDLIRPNLLAFLGERQILVWAASLVVGALAASASVLFRLAISVVQLPWLGTMSERVAIAAQSVSWPVILLTPAIGGLVVGGLLTFIPSRRAGGPADVIEAQAFGRPRLDLFHGLTSALAAAVTLGTGGSAGREGPAIHLGGTLAAVAARHFRLPEGAGRILLGAGVAAAIAASFNAPIAGALFSLEVILRRISGAALPPSSSRQPSAPLSAGSCSASSRPS